MQQENEFNIGRMMAHILEYHPSSLMFIGGSTFVGIGAAVLSGQVGIPFVTLGVSIILVAAGRKM